MPAIAPVRGLLPGVAPAADDDQRQADRQRRDRRSAAAATSSPSSRRWCRQVSTESVRRRRPRSDPHRRASAAAPRCWRRDPASPSFAAWHRHPRHDGGAAAAGSTCSNGDAISRQGPRIVDGAAAVCGALDEVRARARRRASSAQRALPALGGAARERRRRRVAPARHRADLAQRPPRQADVAAVQDQPVVRVARRNASRHALEQPQSRPRAACVPSARPVRLATRKTCVSTASVGSPKATLSTTLAVLRPTPGRASSASRVARHLAAVLLDQDAAGRVQVLRLGAEQADRA